MSQHRSLTQLAHARLASALQPGDLAVDATAGNGHDTLFLAQQVSPGGSVYAFDIQHQALDGTALRLYEAGLRDHVVLCRTGHQNMLDRITPDWIGEVAAITYNLGYLPGSEKRTTTQAETTLAALEQSLCLLKPGGALSILAYRGHQGGQHETDAVQDWLTRHSDELACERIDSRGPVLLFCLKR